MHQVDDNPADKPTVAVDAMQDTPGADHTAAADMQPVLHYPQDTRKVAS